MADGMPTDITAVPAGAIARRIKAGEGSAREVVEAHIRRIEAVNRRLNAVVVPLFDEALAQAKAADGVQARGESLGPLHGVPVTIKDQFRVAGTPTTLGLRHLANKKEDSDGPLVARLRRTGAVILGKTNLAQTLLYYESYNSVYGVTRNPWDLDRTPGGSSGGESAIISAGGSPLGLAADFGGSIRVPAHFCGIQGLKPTSGRLSNEGSSVELFPAVRDALLQQPGPMARSVEDLRLVMDVFTAPGPELTLGLVPPSPLPGPEGSSLSGLRIGMYTDDGFFRASPALRRAVEQAAKALQSRGARIEAFTPPDVAEAISLYLAILAADGGASFKALLAGERPEPPVKAFLKGAALPNALRPVVARVYEALGQRRLTYAIRPRARLSPGDHSRLMAERDSYRDRFLKSMDNAGVDVLICPPFGVPAITHNSGDQHLPFSSGSYAVLYNLLGMPAGTVAATWVAKGEESDRPPSKDPTERAAAVTERGSAGLPVGVQVAARHWREDLVLAVMAAIEEELKGRPDYPRCPVDLQRVQ